MDVTIAPEMTPYFIEPDSRGGGAATRVSSLTSKTTTCYRTSAKVIDASKGSLFENEMESKNEVEKEIDFESDSLEGMNGYKDFSMKGFKWSDEEQKGNVEEYEARVGQGAVSLEESISGKRLVEEHYEKVDQENMSRRGVVASRISGKAEEKTKKKVRLSSTELVG